MDGINDAEYEIEYLDEDCNIDGSIDSTEYGEIEYLEEELLQDYESEIRSDEELLSELDEAEPKPRKYKHCSRWKLIPGFQPWLTINPQIPGTVWCAACEKSLVAELSNIKTHATGKKHCKNAGLLVPPTEEDFIIPNENERKRSIAKIETSIVAAMVDLNISFKNTKKFVKILQSFDEQGMGLIQEVQLSYTKAQKIVINVIGRAHQEEVKEKLQTTPFAISVDESTDTSAQKVLCVSIRYTDTEENRVKSLLWDMLPIFEAGKEGKATADVLFNVTKQSFEEMKIPMTNIHSASMDNCNTMIGHKHGFISKLRSELPHILCVPCPAHLISLCIKYAVDCIPFEIMQLIKNSYSLFKSGKRSHDYKDVQEELSVPIHAILRYTPVRWSSLFLCVDRILEQWDALYEFTLRLKKDPNEVLAGQIFDTMSKNDCKSYFYLIHKVTSIFNKFVMFLQRDDCIITDVYNNLVKCFKDITSIVIRRDYIVNTNESDINLFEVKNYLSFDMFEIHECVRDNILEHGNDMEDFCKVAFNFVIRASLQMLERFRAFDMKFLKAVSCLRPRSIVDIEHFVNDNVDTFEDLIQICQMFITDDDHASILSNEWRSLKILSETKGLVEPDSLDNIVLFWNNIQNIKFYPSNHPVFTYLSSFVLNILSVPHANVDPERRFSDLNFIKTNNRNRLAIKTVSGLLKSRQAIKLYSTDNVFKPSERMIDYVHNKNIWN
ncbi:hypothetical protein TKK_0016639 [Trichogramma kaykai]|uniref:DUF4371 domain-containing protein n=1 Tax=Trichogramma kaykai TaxID=54128 RepID=A0ABD2W632_9HYME